MMPQNAFPNWRIYDEYQSARKCAELLTTEELTSYISKQTSKRNRLTNFLIEKGIIDPSTKEVAYRNVLKKKQAESRETH